MGGGPSQQQNDAAERQAQLSEQQVQLGNKEFGIQQDAYNRIKPFAISRLNTGLPYFNYLTDNAGGAAARAFAPARAALARRLSMYGTALPSGYRDAAMRQIDEGQAQTTDQNLENALAANEAAKEQGAQFLTGQQTIANPTAYFGTAASANNSIMNAPLASPGIGGLIGGALTGVASKIPF